jgi:hypothetical protein
MQNTVLLHQKSKITTIETFCIKYGNYFSFLESTYK